MLATYRSTFGYALVGAGAAVGCAAAVGILAAGMDRPGVVGAIDPSPAVARCWDGSCTGAMALPTRVPLALPVPASGCWGGSCTATPEGRQFNCRPNQAPLAEPNPTRQDAASRPGTLTLLLLAAGLLAAWLTVNWLFLAAGYAGYWATELVFWPATLALLWMAARRAAARPYLVLWLVGLFFWLAAYHWLRLPYWATGFGWVALACYFAFYLPVFIGLSRVAVHRLRVPVMVAAPVVWTGLELARAHLLSGMTMASLAHTQYHWVQVIQISDLAGCYAVSFLVMFVAAAIARALPCDGSRRAFWPLAAGAALTAAALGYGWFRTSGDYTRPARTWPSSRAASTRRWEAIWTCATTSSVTTSTLHRRGGRLRQARPAGVARIDVRPALVHLRPGRRRTRGLR